MRFIHVGDTHIGNVYKSRTRNEDFKDVFRQFIDLAIKERVDFIVHSGDLFNEGSPSLESLLFVTDQLNRLKQVGIRLFVIPGSHDVGIGEENSIIELFDRNGLLTNLNSKRYVSNDGESFTLGGETYKNAFLCGVAGKRSNVEDGIFKRLRINIDGRPWIKIFAFHHTISSLGEQFKDLDTDSLPKDFDYYAAGHWHGHKDGIPYGKGVIQYPGSTEYCDEKEMVDNSNRGCYIVDYDESGIKKTDYFVFDTREKEVYEIDVNGKTPQAIESEMLSKLKKSNGGLLVLRLYGRIYGTRGDLNLAFVKRSALDLGYSYVSINSSRLTDKNDVKVDIKENDLEKIEKEFLLKRGYKEDDVRLARFLIDAVERGMGEDAIIKTAEEMFTKYDNKRD